MPVPSEKSAEVRLSGADPRIFRFLNAWRQARKGRLVPEKRDFDPLNVPDLLPYTWLYRYRPELGDFVCRLAGEEVNAAWGASIKGKTLKEVVGDKDHEIVLQRWRSILTVPQSLYGKSDERLTEITHRSAQRLLLPLTDPDGLPAFMLGISLYTFSKNTKPRPTLEESDIIQIPCVDL